MEKDKVLRFFGFEEYVIPAKREFCEWTDENKCGFLGVMDFGIEKHKKEIVKFVERGESEKLDDLIQKYYDYYIWPFLNK